MAQRRVYGRKHKPRTIEYVACYAMYAVLLVLCYVDLLVWREMIALLLPAVLHNNFTNSALYALLVVLIGLVLFIVAMASEPYLRTGIARGKLLPRFFTVAGTLVGVIAVGLALQELIIVLA